MALFFLLKKCGSQGFATDRQIDKEEAKRMTQRIAVVGVCEARRDTLFSVFFALSVSCSNQYDLRLQGHVTVSKPRSPGFPGDTSRYCMLPARSRTGSPYIPISRTHVRTHMRAND